MTDRAHPLRHARTALAVALLAAVAAAPLALPATAAAGDTFTVTRIPAKVSLAQLQSEARGVRGQMDGLKKDIDRITRRYDAAYVRFSDAGRRLAQTRLQLTGTLARLDAQRAIMAARAVALYKSSDFTLMDVLVGSSSLDDLQSDVQLLDLVARQDQQAETFLQALATGAQGLERAVQQQRQQADAARTALDEQRAELADRLAARKAILESLTRRIDKLLSAGLPPGLGPVNGSYSPLSWAKALLQKLGMPVTTPNVAAVTAWELAEGGQWHNTAHYNPLNTTQPMPGATAMNSVGVKAYTSWRQGFAATVITLHNGNYAGILAALRRGDDAQAVADAVGASPWGTSAFDVAGLVGG